MKEKKEVIKWITWKDIEENIYYEIDDFTEDYEKAIIKEIINNNFLICGDTHQEKCIPVFRNNEYVLLSMRRWGELMAEIERLRYPNKHYTYLEYYMACTCPEVERLPYEE